MKEVVIVAAKRTPIGSFGGKLSTLSATKLGGIAIQATLKSINLDPKEVQEIYFGNVLSANLGQAPATQAAKFGGLGDLPSTTINKVCASGTKAIMLAASAIASGEADVIVAGGMECMSQTPFYLDKVRVGQKLGDFSAIDGLVKDGLWDVYNNYHMGSAAELCASDHQITREMQDEFATNSYKKAQKAIADGCFKNEIAPVTLKTKKGDEIVDTDQEAFSVNFEKLPTLRTVFQKEGTVTAANASSLNDGAAALVLMSREKATELGLKPLAKILSYADAQQRPEHFTTTPAKAIPLALKKANLTLEQVDYFEINEAFSVVSLANNQLLKLDASKVNVYGGAVALGHPLGASGARIVVTLLSVLTQNKGKIGVAAICNGGGGASALVVENLL